MRKKTNILTKTATEQFQKFTGKENHDFTLKQASEWTKRYRELNPGEQLASFFGKDAIQKILNQTDCVGIRIYYAVDPANDEKHFILVGADANQNDLHQGLIAERGKNSPTMSGKLNSLNS